MVAAPENACHDKQLTPDSQINKGNTTERLPHNQRMASSSEFLGFPAGTQLFLAGISANNDRDWFNAHRADYEAFYVAPALAFIAAIGPRLVAEVAPEVQFEARINGSLFRINRDIRFSRDKTPYKDHLDMWFWQGSRKGWDSPGFFFRMLPGRLIVGAGMHRFGPQQLRAFRKAVIEEKAGSELAALRARLDQLGYESGERSKSLPRGFDPNHPRADLLRMLGLVATLETPVPAQAASPDFVDYCLGHYKAVNPINDWLRSNLV